MEDKVKESFLKNVQSHKMEIVIDNGCYRFIRFKTVGTLFYHFNITTFPGYLCISGDMGCYMFSELYDMFDFFRSNDLRINADYWSEKVEAHDKRAGVEEWSREKFIKNVLDHASNLLEGKFKSELEREKAMEAVKSHFEHVEDEFESMILIDTWVDPGIGVDFYDFREYNNKEYTFRFLWCCYAIVWAIQQYDAVKGEDSDGEKRDQEVAG